MGDRRPLGGVGRGPVRPSLLPPLHAAIVLLSGVERLPVVHRLLCHHGRRAVLPLHGMLLY